MRKTYLKALKILVVWLILFISGCAVVEKGVNILPTGGKISEKDKKAVIKTSQALRKTFADITEEEEYYIGRTVAALILSRYPVYNHKALTSYVNYVGNAVAIYSDRPEIYSGYHFLILDSEEVNALSAPGGFIFISKGLLKRCRDEEMLASILAHEIGHVSAKHGLKSIKKSRLIDAFKIIGQQIAQRYSPEKLAKLTDIFEGVLSDIAEKLIERGYDRKYEYEADKLGVKFASRTGYDPHGLADFLKAMVAEASKPGLKGWFQTHPSPQDRLARVNKEIEGLTEVPKKDKVRTQRFVRAIRGLK
ncbi:MAG: M48 family metalloprotease [Candidatus Aminicenantales bacterium]